MSLLLNETDELHKDIAARDDFIAAQDDERESLIEDLAREMQQHRIANVKAEMERNRAETYRTGLALALDDRDKQHARIVALEAENVMLHTHIRNIDGNLSAPETAQGR